jgi:hypothetical protein
VETPVPDKHYLSSAPLYSHYVRTMTTVGLCGPVSPAEDPPNQQSGDERYGAVQ